MSPLRWSTEQQEEVCSNNEDPRPRKRDHWSVSSPSAHWDQSSQITHFNSVVF